MANVKKKQKKKHIAKRQKHILKTEILNLQEAFHQLLSELPKFRSGYEVVIQKWFFYYQSKGNTDNKY